MPSISRTRYNDLLAKEQIADAATASGLPAPHDLALKLKAIASSYFGGDGDDTVLIRRDGGLSLTLGDLRRL